MIYTPQTLVLAESFSAYEKDPPKFHGYIEKRTKRAVHFRVNGKPYTFNTHAVLCSRRILDDGITWYSFCSSGDELFDTYSENRAYAEMLSTGRDWKGLIYK